jgi:stearoyl-CoA desaturase (delta-9 desaturase)
MIDGLLDFSFGGYLLATLFLTHITIAAVTIYLHRCQAHRALELHPVVSHFFRFWLWLTTGMVTQQWVAVHRKHHAFCETDGDPHSPQLLGLRKVLLEGAELYCVAADDQETLRRFGSGTPDDWMERNLYQRFKNGGICLLVPINFALFGIPGIAIWAVQMLWIPFWAAGIINGVGHYFGYRNYEVKEAATNIVPWGIVVGGEELHNNHHAFPSSAKLSSKPWEFDLGWFYIRLLEGLGLAKVKNVPVRPRLDPAKENVDLDTLRAVIMHRLHIMARYARTVTLPVLKQELPNVDARYRSMLKRARGALVREGGLIDQRARENLQRALGESDRLRVVYEYREQLQQIWERTAAGQEQMMSALQEWCSRAEASGIQVLQEFARNLRCYSMRPVRTLHGGDGLTA